MQVKTSSRQKSLSKICFNIEPVSQIVSQRQNSIGSLSRDDMFISNHLTQIKAEYWASSTLGPDFSTELNHWVH